MDIARPKLGDLANEFASTFGLFEFALKECKFYDVHPKTGEVQTSWAKFSKSHPEFNQAYFEKLKSEAATSTIILQPPQKLRELSGRPDWAPASDVVNMESLYFAVKRVRNNLFHGDKAHWNPSRDPPLIEAALNVVRLILADAQDVADAYNKGAMAFRLQLT